MNIKELAELQKNSINWNIDTEEKAVEYVESDGINLREVPFQFRTEKVCIAAVKDNGNALGYVINQTHEICIAAVNNSGYALGYVINQTPEICMAAVKDYGYALQFVNIDLSEHLENDDIITLNGFKYRKIGE